MKNKAKVLVTTFMTLTMLFSLAYGAWADSNSSADSNSFNEEKGKAKDITSLGFSSNVRASDTFSFKTASAKGKLNISSGRVPDNISINDGASNINLSNAKISLLEGTDGIAYSITNLPQVDKAKSYTLKISNSKISLDNIAFKPENSSNTDLRMLNNAIHISSIDNANSSIYMVPHYNVEQLLAEIDSTDHYIQNYSVTDSSGAEKSLSDEIVNNDILTVAAEDGTVKKFTIHLSTLKANLQQYTIGQTQDITLEYSINRTTPERKYLYGTLTFNLPDGITASSKDTFDLIGRGSVQLNNAAIAAAKDYNHSGRNWVRDINSNEDLRTKVEITNGGKTVSIKNTDFSAYNGVDVILILKNKTIPRKGGAFSATFSGKAYSGTPREVDYTETGTSKFNVTSNVTNLVRKADEVSYIKPTTVVLEADSLNKHAAVYASLDKGLTWVNTGEVLKSQQAKLTNLLPDTNYYFKLVTSDGSSNMVSYYSGIYDVTNFGAVADATVISSTYDIIKYTGTDNSVSINAAIAAASKNGGGKVYFKGNSNFASNSIHLRSNVYLYFDKNSQLIALDNIDSRENSLNYPFALGQDDGHGYWEDALMWGVRVENIKIVGNSAKFYGNMNLYTGYSTPAVPGRGTKTISLKLSKNIVIGGIDEDNILTFEQGGWFSILTTGCDDIRVQNILLPNSSSDRQRDTFNFMQDNNASAYNVTTLKSSNDVAKLGSDFSLGFIRHVSNNDIEKIVAGDIDGGNVFQLGSETVGDIKDIKVKNLSLTTNANKTGVAIWVNDGSNISNVTFSDLKLENTSGGIAFGVTPRFEGAGLDEDGSLQTSRLPLGIRRPGSISDVTVDGAVLSKNAGGDGAFPIVIQGYKRFPSTGAAGTIDVGSVGTIVDGKTYPVRNITIKNLKLMASYNPAKTASMPVLSNAAQVIAEAKNGGNYRTSTYANANLFPAYGILLKYVDDITIKDSSIQYEDILRNDRFAIVIDNGTDVNLSNLNILQGGLIGSAIQVRGTSSYNFKNIAVKTFIKSYKTQSAKVYPKANGNTKFDSSVQANLSQSYVFPNIVSDTGVAIAFTSTHINSVSDRAIDIKAGATVGNVLDELISLYGVQTISVVDGSGNAAALTAAVTTDNSLKVISADGTKTKLLVFTIDGAVQVNSLIDAA
ncbi:hypothetical protein EHS13_23550 [Paenibacillus psychroresistens]|uniref:Uncharacterized protein n=1 Tax=Paenibacillus psychroresistens TaxID=1778678 RepID=A0A6B8RMP0_9BACL|nr:hypothetical protein [Paenibacillus psychroresistens]QGQ97651.1 hypothetical protein EHS13_23550 [Paenibacillus psychroresistens]